MTLGSRIKEFRLRRGYTQAQMAEKLNMTEANFSSYERDKSEPPSDKLYKIAQILDVSTDYLLGRNNDRKTEDEKASKVYKMIARSEKLEKLPPEKIEQVREFIDFLYDQGNKKKD